MKTKWLVYTVLVGLLPALSRFIVWLVTVDGTTNVFSAPDFVAFGLVLHISNINEIEHHNKIDQSWKTVQNGTSISFIAFYSVLLALTFLGSDVVNIKAITACAMVMSLVSFVLSYSVYDRISKDTRVGEVRSK